METRFNLSAPPGLKSDRRQRRKVTQSHWATEQIQRLKHDESVVTLPQRTALLEAHGDFSLAYSTAVQPLLRYFGDDSGYIAYRQRWGVTFALGDPMTETGQRGALLKSFVEQFPSSVFCQVSPAVAQDLSEIGYRVNEFGVDTRLILKDYSLNGKEKEWLRYAANWGNRRGYEVRDADFDSIDTEEVEAISEAWRKTRTVKRKEVRFLNRPIVLAQEKDVRRFFLFNPEGKMEAYVFFDPLYRNGKPIGYVTTFKRRHPEATQYAEQAIMKMAIEQFKSEGVEEIRLGFSPCAGIESSPYDHSWFANKLFQTVYRSRMINRYAYNLVGHAEYKKRFRGVEEKVYYASRSRFPLRSLSALIGLCGIA